MLIELKSTRSIVLKVVSEPSPEEYAWFLMPENNTTNTQLNHKGPGAKMVYVFLLSFKVLSSIMSWYMKKKNN